MNFEFHTRFVEQGEFGSYADNFQNFCIHRVNLPDGKALSTDTGLKKLVDSKSGIAIIDSDRGEVLLPPGSSVEVDCWILGESKIILTHSNPIRSELDRYPTLEQFFESWNIKRGLEQELGISSGKILANLKSHGGEEGLLALCKEQGIPSSEVVLLDVEFPAIDRLLRSRVANPAPVALRISRIEPLDSVITILRQSNTFVPPQAVFYDPIGFGDPAATSLIDQEGVKEMYQLAPDLSFFLCCPSRWGREDQIAPLAHLLKECGFKKPVVMTDIDKILVWQPLLEHW